MKRIYVLLAALLVFSASLLVVGFTSTTKDSLSLSYHIDKGITTESQYPYTAKLSSGPYGIETESLYPYSGPDSEDLPVVSEEVTESLSLSYHIDKGITIESEYPY